MIDIKFTPEKNGILLNQENTFDVLLKISSEVEDSPKETERLPLNLSLVKRQKNVHQCSSIA